MQPLDTAFLGPLKCYCGQEAESWLRANPHPAVTIYQVKGKGKVVPVLN
jgi:hypothetical protein